MGYHWRELATRYLFHGDRPLVEAFGSGGKSSIESQGSY